MNRKTTIVLFASIFAVALGTVGLSTNFASTSIVSAVTQETQEVGMLGHVEYIVTDESGSIKSYMQGDNTVMDQGKDCVARLTFDNSTADVCPKGNNVFDYIAIGNYTADASDPLDTLTALETDDAGNCASSGQAGEMARKQITPEFTAAGATGTTITLDTKDSPFDFRTDNSSANIMQSGVFNGPNGSFNANGSCGTLGSASVFAIQNLSTDQGIAVSDGDSLSVKWTITIGS